MLDTAIQSMYGTLDLGEKSMMIQQDEGKKEERETTEKNEQVNETREEVLIQQSYITPNTKSSMQFADIILLIIVPILVMKLLTSR